MAWFFSYGWLVPLTFLLVFLSLFLFNRKNLPFYRCGYPDQEFHGREGDNIRTKIHVLEGELNEIKRQYQNVPSKNLKERIGDLKDEIDALGRKFESNNS